MTTPLWCLAITALLPYLLAFTGAKFRVDQLGGLDNNHPRVQANELRGIAHRAYAAQQNAWEALGLFTACVVIAHLAGADPSTAATASIVFVVARVGHAVAYLADQAIPRSIIQFVGLACCFTLIGSAVRA